MKLFNETERYRNLQSSVNDCGVDWRSADKGFIFTASGKRMYFLKPEDCEVDILDICYGISHNLRWNGNTRIPWTVAQHSLLVADMIDELKWKTPVKNMQLAKLIGLTHDFTEAYLGDIASPIKRELELYIEVEKMIEDRVAGHLDIKGLVDEEMVKLVKRADTLSMLLEAKHLVKIDSSYEKYVDMELERNYYDVRGELLVEKYKDRFKVENPHYVAGKLLCRLHKCLKENGRDMECFNGIPEKTVTEDGMTPIFIDDELKYRVYEFKRQVFVKRESDHVSFTLSREVFDNITDINSVENICREV